MSQTFLKSCGPVQQKEKGKIRIRIRRRKEERERGKKERKVVMKPIKSLTKPSICPYWSGLQRDRYHMLDGGLCDPLART